MAGRYAHARQFKRMNKQIKFLRPRLGRITRDIQKNIDGNEALEDIFARPLAKARAPYEFGVKVSLTTTNKRCKGGQFILHAKALPGNPYDAHTLKDVLEETEALTGREIERVYVDKGYVDKGYVGHDAPKPDRVFRSGQKRGVHGQIKRELRRRSAIEPVIGHCKSDGHLDRNSLKGQHGDRINAVLSAVGYNMRILLKWLRKLLCQIIAATWGVMPTSELRGAS